jgi:hypothetical protein
MVFLLDSIIGDIISTLKAHGFWDNLLVVREALAVVQCLFFFVLPLVFHTAF